MTCSSAEVTCSSASGKRSREPEDEVYLDNVQSHKRYLSEVMVSGLNGLTVGDSLGENLMESPARSESICYPRDEFSPQCSPMPEDLEDFRYCNTPLNTPSLHSETTSCPTSPVSPHCHQRLSPAQPSTSNMYPPPPSCTPANAVCSNSRKRSSDSDDIRFPPSPSDVCHTGDLRRAALLRSVQMRVHPHCPLAYELPLDKDLSSDREAADYIDDCSAAAAEEGSLSGVPAQ